MDFQNLLEVQSIDSKFEMVLILEVVLMLEVAIMLEVALMLKVFLMSDCFKWLDCFKSHFDKMNLVNLHRSR
jgi:hypothetical protein